MAAFIPVEYNALGEEICGCICHRYPEGEVMHCVPCCSPGPKREPAKIVYTFPNGGNVYDDDDEQ